MVPPALRALEALGPALEAHLQLLLPALVRLICPGAGSKPKILPCQTDFHDPPRHGRRCCQIAYTYVLAVHKLSGLTCAASSSRSFGVHVCAPLTFAITH